MKIRIPTVIRWHPILSLILACAVIGPCIILYEYFSVDDHSPVSISGVHHLGGDYRINRFYVDKYIGGSAGEGGGGGGSVCCVSLPKLWRPELKAEVRWEVHHIIRAPDSENVERVEIEGIYHAQVPIEAYAEPEHFWVHFFPQGRVRIIVSPIGSEGEQHPIRRGDVKAAQQATTGSVVKDLFTAGEIAESEHETARDRKRYGDWR